MNAAAGRILVINPNSSEAVTAAIDRAVEPLRVAGGPEIAVARLAAGPPGIATQRDADSVVMPLCAWVAGDPSEAFVLACFSDPGLHAVREAAGGRPVMGIAEWGLLRALTLGESFGIVALSPASVKRQARLVRQMGLGARYAGSWPVEASAEETAGEAIRDRLTEAARRLVAERGADVLVLGCAGMAGHRRAIEDAVARPVVEPSQWGVTAALGALRLAGS
jgi:Asp/Glu/hydantoin racemase